MAALRQTGSHCGGPRAGQVLPETQIPPKQFPPCLPVTGRGILRALPGKGLGPGHKGSIFPGKQRGAGCGQLPEEPAHSTHGHSRAGARCLRPRRLCWTRPLPAAGLEAASPPPAPSSGARQLRSLPSRCCTNAGQAGIPGTKSVPGQSRATRCAGAAWLYPCAIAVPWQGPAQLGTGHSQPGGSHTEPSPGSGLGTWPRLVLTRFADVPSLVALPCARHCRSLSVPGLSSLNPFPVKSRSRPAAAPPAAHPGRGGRESGQGGADQRGPRGRAAPPAPAEPLPAEFSIFSVLLQREHKSPAGGRTIRASVSGSGALAAAAADLCRAAAAAFWLRDGVCAGKATRGPGRLPGEL